MAVAGRARGRVRRARRGDLGAPDAVARRPSRAVGRAAGGAARRGRATRRRAPALSGSAAGDELRRARGGRARADHQAATSPRGDPGWLRGRSRASTRSCTWSRASASDARSPTRRTRSGSHRWSTFGSSTSDRRSALAQPLRPSARAGAHAVISAPPRRTPYWTLPAFAVAARAAARLGAGGARGDRARAGRTFRAAHVAARRHAELAAIRGRRSGRDARTRRARRARSSRRPSARGARADRRRERRRQVDDAARDPQRPDRPRAAGDRDRPQGLAGVRAPARARRETRRVGRSGSGLPTGPSHWNPLAYGNPTELKDKLVATERFTEPHYQRAAERYVQTALGGAAGRRAARRSCPKSSR